MASARSAPASPPTRGRCEIVSGGFACVAGDPMTAAWLHDFRSYGDRTDEHGIAEREARAEFGEVTDWPGRSGPRRRAG